MMAMIGLWVVVLLLGLLAVGVVVGSVDIVFLCLIHV